MKEYVLKTHKASPFHWLWIEDGATTIWTIDGNFYIAEMDNEDLPEDAEELTDYDREKLLELAWDVFRFVGGGRALPLAEEAVTKALTEALGKDGHLMLDGFIDAQDAGWDFHECCEHVDILASFAAGGDPFNDEHGYERWSTKCERAGIVSW